MSLLFLVRQLFVKTKRERKKMIVCDAQKYDSYINMKVGIPRGEDR